ncbi:leucyl aminopeptidase [Jiangella anatolica]|uniref:Probable cytosol aminopeptidase n=1 Tax=Jiangella anatolica TaxID=2670374 RepID=A0A2W2C916_9ACTN|nr:leucyl aminopeptidase [Jiangella anatolica]PZF82296.1 leucyl aminopeptidase [Jiangella anatolica]
MTSIALSSAAPNGLKVDAVVVGVAPGDDDVVLLPGSESLDKALKGSLAKVLGQLGATGKADEVTKLPAMGAAKAGLLVAVGTGPLAEAGTPARHESLRRAAGAAARALAGQPSAAVALPILDEQDAAAVVEGLQLGAYTFDQYKSGDPTTPVGSVTLIGPGVKAKGVKDAVARAETVAAAVNRARDWVNMPPRDLTPATFAEAATKLAKSAKLDVEVLDEKALAKGGYGGLIGVGQGSANPPRLVRVAYRPSRAKKHVAFVGKGITFDSGGLSLKPADSMPEMKSDMSGAAAVVAAVHAIAQLGTKVAVTVYAAMAENMPSGSAQRPSDVITIYGGKTVEVLNTDAEGRLVLADGIVRAGEDEPDLIVDVATLTGAAIVALGKRVSGVMANDEELGAAVQDAAGRTGEAMWPLPLPVELREKLDSPVADIANIGDRWGGALQAGLFLQEFVADGIGWAHLDIAGPAFSDKAFGYTPKGGTGAAVRTLVQLVEDVADGRI